MRYGNRFLDALPSDLASALVSGETPRELPFGSMVVQRGDAQQNVHFPLSGAISEIEEQFDGGRVECRAVGPEGISGVEMLLEVAAAPSTRLIQTPTRVLAVRAEVAAAAYERHHALRILANRYVVSTFRATAINVACNARHSSVPRLARWLLRMADRAVSDDVMLTHDATSLLLGVRRATVTVAMQALEAARTVESTRGVVRILDRAALERECCSCYREECALYDELYASVT